MYFYTLIGHRKRSILKTVCDPLSCGLWRQKTKNHRAKKGKKQTKKKKKKISYNLRSKIADFFFHGATAPSGPKSPYCWGFAISLRHTTLGRTPLDEWSARRRDLYLTKHNTHNRRTSMPPARNEPAIPTSERMETHVLDRAATGIGHNSWSRKKK